MQSVRQLKLIGKTVVRQQQIIQELNRLVKDIERGERTIIELRDELESVNRKHHGRSTTRDNIEYLSDLLACAKKKLNWEKHMGSLQKRAPQIMETMSQVINDPQAPPDEETRAQIVRALNAVQSAMERLQNAKVE